MGLTSAGTGLARTLATDRAAMVAMTFLNCMLMK